MNIRKTDSGKRFDFDKAELITSINWRDNDTRGSDLYKTASGNFIVRHWSRWQGEYASFSEATREEAKGYALDNVAFENACLWFPELQEEFQEEI